LSNDSIIGTVSERLRAMLWAAIEPHDHFGLRNNRDIVFTSPATRLGGHSSQLSLWLYHTTTATQRNAPRPRASNNAPAEPVQPIDLHYLITPQATDAEKNLDLFETVLRTLFAQPVLVLDPTPQGRQVLQISEHHDNALERAQIWHSLRTDFQLAAAYDVTGLQLGTA